MGTQDSGWQFEEFDDNELENSKTGSAAAPRTAPYLPGSRILKRGLSFS